MEQDIRFCELDGKRIAYASVGEGPLLLFGGRWVTHLEEEWDDPQARRFYEELARTHRVVRFDRLGTGLSERELGGPPTMESEAGPLAAQMLAGLFVPHGAGDEIAALSRYQRRSADADVAAAFLELDLSADLRAVLPTLTMPALVLHRRGDRTVPIGRGRELASLLPNARFVALAGDAHLPYMDDQRDLQRALAGFLADAVPAESNGHSPLTRRETEVLRLVAAGLSNREIASSLVLSEHTVHRHVANILRKLTQSTRAAAAAHATRAGLI